MILKTLEFSRALNALSGVIPQKAVVPILDHVMISENADIVYVCGSDLEKFVSISLPAMDAFSVCLPFQLLSKTIQSLDSEYVELTKEGNEVKVVSGNSVFRMMSMPTDDFPKFPDMEQSYRVEMDKAYLQNAIKIVTPFSANDDLRPIFSGISLIFDKENVTFYASDSHVLMKVVCPAVSNEAFEVCVNKNVGKIMSYFEDEKVEVLVGDKFFGVRGDTVNYFSRRIEGVIPKFDTVWPQKNDVCEVKAMSNALMKDVNLASIYANKQSNLLKISFKNDEALIESQDVDFSTSSTVKHRCTVKGEMTIGLNSQKLVQILTTLKEYPIEMYMKDNKTAVVFKTIVAEGILMPMLYES